MTIQETISNIGKLIQDFCFTRADVHLSNLSHQGKAEIALQSNGVPWNILSNVLTYVDGVSMNTTASQSTTFNTLGVRNKADIMPPDGSLSYSKIICVNNVTIAEGSTTADLCHIGVNPSDHKATFLVDNSSGSNKLKVSFYDGTSTELGDWTDGTQYEFNFAYDSEGYYKLTCGTVSLTVPEDVSGNIYTDIQTANADNTTAPNGWALETLTVGGAAPTTSTTITPTTITGNISFTGKVHALMPNGHAESHPGMCDSLEADITINSSPMTVSLGSSRKAVLADPTGNISIADYVVSYSAPTGAVADDMWYDLSANRLKKFTTQWTEWMGVKLGTLKYDEAGELIFTLAGAVQVPDFDTVMTEVDTVMTEVELAFDTVMTEVETVMTEVELAKAPVGTVIAYMGTDEPEGYLLMDGRELSRTTYSRLFSVIGTTQGAGDGSTTFNIADMTDGRYLMGSTVAGGSVVASAPNITGQITYRMFTVQANGCSGFVRPGSNSGADNTGTYSNANNRNYAQYDASLNSPIYGASNTIRPLSQTCRLSIKY